MIKGYAETGTIDAMGSVSVECVELTDATTSRHQTGIVMEVKESGRLERSERSFIDYEEIDPLLKGIDYIAKVRSDVTPLANFEAIYKTRGDFSVITFSTRAGVAAAVKCGYIGSVSAYISLEQVLLLRSFIYQAKQKLDSLK